MKRTTVLTLQNLGCANCAARMERAAAKINGISDVVVDFATQKMTIETDDTAPLDAIITNISQAVRRIEADVTVSRGVPSSSSYTPRSSSCADGACAVSDTHHHGTHEDAHAHDSQCHDACCSHDGHDHAQEHTDGNDSHGHSHAHEGASKSRLVIMGIGAALFFAGFFLPLEGMARLAWYLAAYLLIGGDVLWSAARGVIHGQLFDENFLMTIATVGAFIIGEYPEGVAVMLFYQVGELFQSYAVGRSRRSIAALMDIRPDSANLKTANGVITVAPESVQTGDMILVRPGEKIPLDGVIREGSSSLDTSALTGESMPRDAAPGDSVLGGCINKSGLLTIEVTRPYAQSAVAKILELVENASSKKAPAERFITKFSRYYTPFVVIFALLLAFIPPLVLPGAVLSDWVYRALVFLVVSCPCALVISVPLGFFGGIGGASRHGILIKGGNYLEALSKAETVVFDKTGTLTHGEFRVTAIHPEGMTENELLSLAAHAEMHSTHPIARSIVSAFGSTPDEGAISDFEELAGHGIRATVSGKTVYAGNARLMEREGLQARTPGTPGAVVHLALDGRYVGYIQVSDTLRRDAKAAMAALRATGVRKTVMLTGDTKESAAHTAKQLDIDQFEAGLLPGDKVTQVERLMDARSRTGKLVFVGDGINDAPVLARSDIGVAMGGIGSDAAIEAADVVIMTDEPSRLATAIRISRKTMRIVHQNIVFALAIKLLVLALGSVGHANMWEAVFADVGVSLLAVLNAMRAMHVPQK